MIDHQRNVRGIIHPIAIEITAVNVWAAGVGCGWANTEKDPIDQERQVCGINEVVGIQISVAGAIAGGSRAV
jgi:hypothetical protein